MLEKIVCTFVYITTCTLIYISVYGCRHIELMQYSSLISLRKHTVSFNSSGAATDSVTNNTKHFILSFIVEFKSKV